MGDLTKILDLHDGKWTILPQNIPDPGQHADKALSIFTCVGSFGIGKSFLQNILLGFIQHGENYFEDHNELLEAFPIETSVNSETKGIDMYKDYLIPPVHNETESVLALWDTEGPSDPNQRQDHALTVFGLSAYFSQVLIYNVKEKFSMENMDKMQTFLEEMRTANGGGEQTNLFQTLVIVVRDADEEFGYCWEGGKAYLNHMREEAGGAGQTDAFLRELENTFTQVLVFMMPPPNQEVKTKGIKISRMRDVDLLFRHALRIFAQQLFFEFVEPSSVNGEVLRVGDLEAQLTKLAHHFQNGGERRTHTLANARKEEHIRKVLNDSFKKYQEELLENRGWFQAESTRNERHEELKQKILRDFKIDIELHFVETDVVDAATLELEKLMDKRFEAYNDSAHTAQLAMWVVGGVVISAGVIAAIVCFPAEAAAAGRAVLPHIQRLVLRALPILMPHVEGAVNTLVGPTTVPIGSAVMAIIATIWQPKKV